MVHEIASGTFPVLTPTDAAMGEVAGRALYCMS